MAKKNRQKSRTSQPADGISPRAACPCGSGKRYKACHGAPGGGSVFVARPFAGLPNECDLVAMRELVPSATVALQIKGYEDIPVRLATLLPLASPAMARDSGQVWAGLQVQHHFGDLSREVASVLLTALEKAKAGESDVVGLTADPGPGPRLQDLVTNERLEVTVHDGFEWWIDDVDGPVEGAEGALEQANAAAAPTARLTTVEAAYWTDGGTKEYLRWVMPEPEEELLTALARLHVAGETPILYGARFIGMFRAHGLLAPVWELPLGTGAEALEEPAAAFKEKLDVALADTSEITADIRSARAGLANRQVTIR